MKLIHLLFLAFVTLNLAANGQHTGIGGGNAQPEPTPRPRPSFQPQSILVEVLDWFYGEQDVPEDSDDQRENQDMSK